MYFCKLREGQTLEADADPTRNVGLWARANIAEYC